MKPESPCFLPSRATAIVGGRVNGQSAAAVHRVGPKTGLNSPFPEGGF